MGDLRADNILRLHDGRLLGYGEFGDPGGRPLLFFHGFPGSRLQASLGAAAAARAGVRIIAPDRPGMGLSDFKPGRALLDWPDDVVELADALGIDRFVAAGVSGGGPYAAACAFKIPQRLVRVGIISGLGPFDQPAAAEGMGPAGRLLFGVARRAPWLMHGPAWLLAQGVRHFPDRFMALTERALPASDRAILSRPDVRRAFLEDAAEAFRAGPRGAAWDAVLYGRPWGFRLQDIAVPVYLWHGEADTEVPVSMGRYQANAIPNCQATFFLGEGHFLVVDRIEEILGALFAGPTSAAGDESAGGE